MKIEDLLDNKINKEVVDAFFANSSLQDKAINVLYLYSFTKENKELFLNEFLDLFEKGFSWGILKDLEIFLNKDKTKSAKASEINIFVLKEIIIESFHKYFLRDLNPSNSKDLKLFADLALKLEILNNEEIIKIWNYYNLSANKEDRDSFLKNVQKFSKMEFLCDTFNLSPWLIISKDLNNETFWATQVWQNENKTKIKTKEHGSFEYRKNLFVNGKSVWKNLETNKTKKIDLQSKIVFAAANLPNEHHFNKLLNDLEIKEINLNCKDYIDNIKNEKTLKERFLLLGKIKTLNKFEKKKIGGISYEDLIVSVPNKANLISNKNGFLKQWLSVNEDMNYENILEKVLGSKYRKYSGSTINIKCYLPIKSELLEKDNNYFKQAKLSCFNNNYIEFDNNVVLASFENLLNWLKDKNINLNKKCKNEELLINELIFTIVQLPTDFELINKSIFAEDSIIKIFLKNNSTKQNNEIFQNLIEKWEQVWHHTLEKDHKDYILNTIYKKQSLLFNMIDTLLEYIETLEFKDKSIENNWIKVKEILNNFEKDNESVQNLNKKIHFIELNSNLKVNVDNKKVKFKL